MVGQQPVRGKRINVAKASDHLLVNWLLDSLCNSPSPESRLPLDVSEEESPTGHTPVLAIHPGPNYNSGQQ